MRPNARACFAFVLVFLAACQSKDQSYERKYFSTPEAALRDWYANDQGLKVVAFEELESQLPDKVVLIGFETCRCAGNPSANGGDTLSKVGYDLRHVDSTQTVGKADEPFVEYGKLSLSRDSSNTAIYKYKITLLVPER